MDRVMLVTPTPHYRLFDDISVIVTNPHSMAAFQDEVFIQKETSAGPISKSHFQPQANIFVMEDQGATADSNKRLRASR